MNLSAYLEDALFHRDEVHPVAGFDGSFYINCPGHDDRREEFLAAASAAGVHPLRVPGVILEPKKNETQKERNARGQRGCAASHFRAIHEARRRGLESVLIFEDDATFCDGWLELVEEYRNALEGVTWQLAYLGAMPDRPNLPKGDLLFRTAGVWTTHAYAMNRNFFDDFIRRSESDVVGIDNYFLHQAHLRPFFLFREPLNFQRGKSSIIQGRTWKEGEGNNNEKQIRERYREFCKPRKTNP